MKLYFTGDTKGLYTGIRIILKDLKIKNSKEGMEVVCKKGNCLKVTKKNGKAEIVYSEKAEFFRGLSYIVSREGDFTLEEKTAFSKNGVMLDCSRNAVLSLDTIKYFLRKMALMGLNLCMLYTEDTYEIKDEPYFGYLRGRYTFEELKEIDDYAYALGIEAIPCMQTLSHLERAFQWDAYNDIKNSPYTILVDEEKSYEFIEKMIVAASKPFRTKRIHIGMDEAHDLAEGAHKRIYGEQPRHEVMARHVKRVLQIVKKHKLKAMMWSDMHFRASFGGEYYTDSKTVPTEVIKSIPKDVDQVYWDYYNESEKLLSHMMNVHQSFGTKTIFAGGIWSWKGASADYGITMRTTIPALTQCIKKGIKEVFATAWGDNGAETSVLSILYGLQVYAEFGYKGGYDYEYTKKRFFECTGENADAFLGMTDFHLPVLKTGERVDGYFIKSYLYEDPLLMMYEKDFEDFDLPATFKGMGEKYAKYAEESRGLSDLMNQYSALAEFLYNKAVWREIAPAAVREKDTEKAKEAVLAATALRKSAEKLIKAWRNLWLGRNKPFGFEIIEIRMGGMLSRCVTAEQRIKDFAKGKLKDIPELSQEKLYKIKKPNGAMWYACTYRDTIAPCEL